MPETIPSQPETDAPSDRAPDAVWSMADPHFHEGDPALGTFFAWLEAFRRSGTPDLVLLGDLFRVWVGLPGAQGREQREVLGALGALASEGRRVVYVVGNRDYFAEEAGRAAGMLVSEGWERTVGGRRVRFEHGDLINTSDRQYLMWREFSRSRGVLGLVRSLPDRRKMALARWLEARMADTNASYRDYEPRGEIRRWSSRLAAEGVSLAVVGHFHREAQWLVNGMEVLLLPQFRRSGRHLRLAGDGVARIVDGTGDGES